MKKVFHDNRRKENAYIVFTREPVPGMTKTRLMPYYSAEQCAELHKCFLLDIAEEMKGRGFDIVVAYTGGEPVFLKKAFGEKTVFIEQRGADLGKKMENAIADVLSMGYEKAVLTGTDIPELEADTIETAFAMLGAFDVVLGPTADGGYYLTGMSRVIPEAFEVKLYGTATVFEETMRSMKESGITVGTIDVYHDIDTKEDLEAFTDRMREDAALRHSRSGRYIAQNRRLSVIIPVYNEENTAGRMAEQMRAYKNDAEIIFVDGGSTDRTLEILGDEFSVMSSRKGRALQMNSGAISSSGDILFFLHCDSLLPCDFIQEIRKCMERRQCGCFGVRFSSRNFFMLTNRIISNHRARVRGLPFGDQGIFIDRKLFFEMGMFPEIPVMEDYEFSRKLKRYGIRPGMTSRRILTSDRRYGEKTAEILKTELKMWNLRRLFRKGMEADELAKMYKDIR